MCRSIACGFTAERKAFVNRIHGALVAIAVMLAAVMSGCSGDTGTGESEASGALTASRGEHDREGYGEHDRGGGEHGGAAASTVASRVKNPTPSLPWTRGTTRSETVSA
jgi:hypothetical protein